MFYNFLCDSSGSISGTDNHFSDTNLGIHAVAEDMVPEITENFFS